MYKRNQKAMIGFVTVLLAAPWPVLAAAVNLIQNGDFELGNVAFSSDYAYSPAVNTTEAQYTVRTDLSPWNSSFVEAGDHTTGAGNMFVGNGDPTAESVVWETASISVLPNTDYFFEAWAMNVCCNPTYTGPNSPAILEFSVVGSIVESLGIIPTSFPAGEWQFLRTTWNSGSNTSVDLRIINQNTAVGGNDFALDDIHFSTVSSVPLPAGIWLFGSALPFMLGVTRIRRSL